MGIKIGKTTEVFDNVETLRNQEVTYWAERNEPPVIQIIEL
jgi:hypothetical protein